QPAYHFTVVGGSLPTGLSRADDGTLSGNPAGPVGVSAFTVKVTDSSDSSMSDTRTLSITVGQGTSALAVDPVLIKVTSSLGLSVKLGVVGATLTGGSPAHPIAGQTVVFRAASTTVCSGVTAADGKVTCTMSLANTVLVILNLGVSATYAGSSSWLPASGSAGLLSLG
ncbi:putative Ig domain-containing protein, partial [Nocardioides sp.]|uniref:putative Ig domain-containing protein n=1 Tax=Nocardioides sp. TaxID=35761 RepID=UPI0031FE4D07|nr:S-layer domain protein [Nocardioides sp.]